jgi:hypothetical protein
VSVRDAGTGTGGSTRNLGIGRPKGLGPSGSTVTGPCPGGKIGIWRVFSTVSIQNIADIVMAFAFGFAAAGHCGRDRRTWRGCGDLINFEVARYGERGLETVGHF